ncbi:hypothetical protein CK203_058313 [Vitis vinifera]|uniref:Retrotransposon gag domain-containing protein n=1 Tax=Vitis vinifera TaxID=29760 RepID=A0A438GE32_VITVI|nr:hypothetical protein CK203_058313 [Vitis vinifera]
MEATPEDQYSHHGHQDNPNAFRSMRDRMHPPRMSAPSCIVPLTEQLVIRPHIMPLLPTFHGMESENPYAHIKEFEDVCNTFQEGGASIDLMRLKLFPFTLKDKAKIWLNSLRPRTTLETMCGGDFMSKNPKEAMDFLNYIAKVSRGWDKLNKGEVGKTKSQPNAFNAKAGIYTLNEDIDMKAKVAAMTRRLEELELKKICEVQVVAETPVQIMPCSICQSYEHLVEECPTIPAVREMFGDQENVIGQFKPKQCFIWKYYNSNWRNHPNFFWKQEHFRKVSSQPHQNPKGIHEVEAHEGESSQVRDVKALITLRSGKEVELPTPKPHVEKEEKEEETEKIEEIKGKKKVAVKGKRTMIQQ